MKMYRKQATMAMVLIVAVLFCACGIKTEGATHSTEIRQTEVFTFPVVTQSIYLNEIAPFDKNTLPCEVIDEMGDACIFRGETYIEIEREANYIRTSTWHGWKADLSLFKAIAKTEHSDVVLKMDCEGGELLMLLSCNEGEEYIWLLHEKQDVLNVQNYELDDFIVYNDGVRVDQNKDEYAQIWSYHKDAKSAKQVYPVLDGDAECHRLDLICKQYPALVYELNYYYLDGVFCVYNMQNGFVISRTGDDSLS